MRYTVSLHAARIFCGSGLVINNHISRRSSSLSPSCQTEKFICVQCTYIHIRVMYLPIKFLVPTYVKFSLKIIHAMVYRYIGTFPLFQIQMVLVYYQFCCCLTLPYLSVTIITVIRIIRITNGILCSLSTCNI